MYPSFNHRYGTDPVCVVKSGTSVYVRHAYSGTHDIVRCVSVGTSPSTSNNGGIDFIGAKRIPSTTAPEDTRTAYVAALEADWLIVSGDNNPPEKFNGMYLGGGHGITSYQITKTGHGLTAAAVGDTGTDSAAKSWVLTRIVDANNVLVTPANTGSANEWRIAGAITGSTITFATAGAFAFTASALTQAWPALQDYVVTALIDDTVITADGTYSGERAEIREEYGIPNAADWLATLISEKGTSSPKNPSDSSIDTQIEVNCSWQFDRYGARTGYFDHYVVQPYTRIAESDYYGAHQQQVLYRRSGESVWAYVPGVSGTISGYDLTAGADVTANASTVNVEKADCVDTANPASHFAQYVKDSGGTPRFGYVMGYARHIGLGVPASRAAAITRAFQLSPIEKMYPYAKDTSAGATASAGESDMVVTYDGYHDMSNATHTVNRLVEYADGKVHWIFDVHATLSGEWVVPGTLGRVPPELIGRPVTLLDGVQFTLHTDDVLTAKGFRVTTTDGYGRAVVQIG